MTESTDLIDPIVNALKRVSEAALKNDEMILDVVRALINRVLSLEARIEELELLSPETKEKN